MPRYQDYAKIPQQTYKAPAKKPGISEAQKARRAAVVAARRKADAQAAASAQAKRDAAEAAKFKAVQAKAQAAQRDLFAEREKTTYVPQQVQAEVGDTFGSIAADLGIPVEAVIKANELDTTVKAGAVYNVPRYDSNVETYDEFLARASGVTQPTQQEDKLNIFKDILNYQTESTLPEMIKGGAEWLKDTLFPPDETSYLPGGGNVLASPTGYSDPFEGPAADAYWGALETPDDRRIPTGFGEVPTDYKAAAGGPPGTSISQYDPFPTMPGVEDYSDERNLYDAASQQMKDIYELDPTIRYGKFGFDILGLEMFERQDNMDAIAEIALEPFMKPFTANYLASFGNDVRAVWNDETGQYELEGVFDPATMPPGDLKRLVDLGYITPTSDGGIPAGGYSSSGVTARYPSPIYQSPTYGGLGGYSGAKQDYRRNPAYLSLTSWSI